MRRGRRGLDRSLASESKESLRHLAFYLTALLHRRPAPSFSFRLCASVPRRILFFRVPYRAAPSVATMNIEAVASSCGGVASWHAWLKQADCYASPVTKRTLLQGYPSFSRSDAVFFLSCSQGLIGERFQRSLRSMREAFVIVDQV